MKISLDQIDRTQFMVHEHILNGELIYLIQPQHFGVNWDQQNKIFRSSLWNSKGELVSAGFPKFTNWGEKPEQFPVPTSLKNATVVEKVDGSLLVVSKYKGNLMLRTRGTVDASKLDNGSELEVFRQLFKPYHDMLDTRYDTWDFSLLFEWVSPINKIVLNYGDQPDWFFVGGIQHKNYELWSQVVLDRMAESRGLKRPQTYTFTDVADLLANVDQWKGKEGVCVYSHEGQSIHKVKSAWYLVRHHMKSELNNVEKVLDFWFENGKPEFPAFKDLVLAFDYEIWEQVQGHASRISDAYKEVLNIIEGMKRFIAVELSKYPTRKLQAVVTFQSYGKNSNRSSFIFKLLDGKELNDADLKKLMFQVLKNL